MAPEKKALVIGCQGQDGSLLCNSLLRKNFTVIGGCRNTEKQSKNHVMLGIDKDVQIQRCDINDSENILNIISNERPDQIYNLAAQSSVGVSFNNPEETINTIVNGTLNILESCKKIGYEGDIFFAGSSEIFGQTDIAADINHKHSPSSPYAIAKQSSFNLVKLYREIYNLQCKTGILFNHESPLRNERFVTHKIISGAIKCMKDRNHKLEMGNINIYRDWGWAEEYVEAVQLMNSRTNNNDHIICTGKLTKLRDFIAITFDKLNLNFHDHIIINPKYIRKKEIIRSFGDPAPFFNKFQWQTKLQISEIIDNLIEAKLKKGSIVNF